MDVFHSIIAITKVEFWNTKRNLHKQLQDPFSLCPLGGEMLLYLGQTRSSFINFSTECQFSHLKIEHLKATELL